MRTFPIKRSGDNLSPTPFYIERLLIFTNKIFRNLDKVLKCVHDYDIIKLY